MFQWSNRPPEDAHRPGLRLTRAPTKGALVGVIVSTELTGLFTHFQNGRTKPCIGQGCDSCQHANPKRWHAWVAYMDVMTRELCLLEMTAQAAEQLLKYKEKWQTLRGCHFKIGRPSQTPNGRVHLVTQRWADPDEKLVAEPDVQAALYTIWGVVNNIPVFNPRTVPTTDAYPQKPAVSRNGSH